MCLNSIGLAVMGMVGHEVILNRVDLEKAVTAVAKIDWSRDNELWEGTLRVGPGVARGGNVIELGGSIVKAVGGLPLTARDIERIKAVDGLAAKLPPGCLETPPIPAEAETVAVVDADAQDGNDETTETVELADSALAGVEGGVQ